MSTEISLRSSVLWKKNIVIATDFFSNTLCYSNIIYCDFWVFFQHWLQENIYGNADSIGQFDRFPLPGSRLSINPPHRCSEAAAGSSSPRWQPAPDCTRAPSHPERRRTATPGGTTAEHTYTLVAANSTRKKRQTRSRVVIKCTFFKGERGKTRTV